MAYQFPLEAYFFSFGWIWEQGKCLWRLQDVQNTDMKTTLDATVTLTTTWQIIPQNGELLKVSLKQKLLFIKNVYLLVFNFPK